MSSNVSHKTVKCAKMKLTQFCAYSEIDLDEIRKPLPNILEVRHSSPGLIVEFLNLLQLSQNKNCLTSREWMDGPASCSILS